ncbi:hypothetical protein ABZY68_00060 [Streptomyces sp. NPDC006482]|uniref:hypothetical protein n=1 Tax=unclassified Streptomyces TaxID=2593676 RepID=UPI00225070E9|nr:hypothetical protein [Streptomyces sp. NBC_00094]MCX5392043.1 hypothetical protein [Streptomyces sp. NBC_00094]
MRKLATAVVAAGLFFGGMGVAVADSWHGLTMTTTGAKFTGRYMWEPQLQKHGGLRVKGRLEDLISNDGHNVYINSKVEGYPWIRTKGIQGKTVAVDKVFFDGALLVTDFVEVQLCRDRGSLRPDNCSDLRKFER